MKKLAFILFVACSWNQIYSQDTIIAEKNHVGFTSNLPHYDMQRFHAGFNLGIQDFIFLVDPNTEDGATDSIMPFRNQGNAGFTLGIVANARISNNVDLRFNPEISIINQSLYFSILQNGKLHNEVYSFQSTQLGLPLLLKLKSNRVNNHRPYILVGVDYQVGLSRKQQSPKVGQGFQFHDDNVSLIAGFGLDNYLSTFKLSPELCFSFGLKNLVLDNESSYSMSINKLYSRVISLRFSFE